jgi:molybdate transport system ATP-binding protein
MKLEVSLQKSYGEFAFAADFAVCGQRIGVFGPSGSGKSTLVGMLAGLTHPDRGSIRLDGEALYDARRGINLPPERRRVGVVFQHAHLFPHLTVRKNLLYGYKRISAAERRIDPAALCEILDLGQLLERDVTTLSGGERQRVALGRAVLACPRLLLMDEPLTGLDEGRKLRIIPYLTRVGAEFAIPMLFISHALLEMRLMTETVLEFAQGRLVGETTPEELARRRLGTSRVGYINLLPLVGAGPCEDLWNFRWGQTPLVLTEPGEEGRESLFELSSKDVTLFKRHPEASSARNMLEGRVRELFQVGNRVGVELDCGGRTLVAQVVGDAARELDLRVGSQVVAVIKASAFRRLY